MKYLVNNTEVERKEMIKAIREDKVLQGSATGIVKFMEDMANKNVTGTYFLGKSRVVE